jgi:predicted PurR-regulated permease PerM
LKPLLISNAIDVPLVIVLFGVLGGLLAFGLIELFLSPLILAVLLSIWREWVSDDGPSSENLRIEGTEACTPVTPKAL